MQVTVIGLMGQWTIRVATVTIGQALLMGLTDTIWTSILAILIRAITITVLTGFLLGVLRTKESLN